MEQRQPRESKGEKIRVEKTKTVESWWEAEVGEGV